MKKLKIDSIVKRNLSSGLKGMKKENFDFEKKAGLKEMKVRESYLTAKMGLSSGLKGFEVMKAQKKGMKEYLKEYLMYQIERKIVMLKKEEIDLEKIEKKGNYSQKLGSQKIELMKKIAKMGIGSQEVVKIESLVKMKIGLKEVVKIESVWMKIDLKQKNLDQKKKIGKQEIGSGKVVKKATGWKKIGLRKNQFGSKMKKKMKEID